jgi:type II secretory pathway pseudopilin PulG
MKGYSFIELLLVLTLIAITAIGAMINFGAALVTFDIEQVTTQASVSIANARRAALRGKENPLIRKFDIVNALPARRPGIILAEDVAEKGKGCTVGCRDRSSICVSGTTFCYKPVKNFTFERYSGRLDEPHAVFVLSKSRKMAILVSPDGNIDVAELLNGEWKLREDLRQKSIGKVVR